MEMHSANLVCHGSAVAISSVACIVGLLLLSNHKQANDDIQETEVTLFRMSFSYWLVYCMAFAVQKIIFPDWETLITSLKITAVLSYFLTFSCVAILPLHKLAVHRVEE